MRKIVYLAITLLSIISWHYILDSDLEYKVNAKKHEEAGDRYYSKELYKDSIIEYKKAYKYEKSEAYIHKILKSMINDDLLKEAFDFTLKLENKGVYKEYQKDILSKFLENKEYKNFNKYYHFALEEIKANFVDIYNYRFEELGDSYKKIKYSVLDKDKFIVSNENKWFLIDEKSKKVLSENFENIISYNKNFLTVQNEDKTLLLDSEKEIRAILNGVNYSMENENILIDLKNKNYLTRDGKIISKKFEKLSIFQNGKAIVKDRGDAYLINNNFKILKKFKNYDFKLDERFNAIYNNKIILKNRNYIIYDINKDKFSKEYEDIDFSYGEYIAVKQNGKWGYIDDEFNEILDFKYDEAYSFSNLIGIIKEKEKYYLIDKKGYKKLGIDKKIFPFNEKGVSFIKYSKYYKMIKLVRFIND